MTREYYLSHKKDILEKQNKARQSNIEKYRKQRNESYLRNREKNLPKFKKYYQENRERIDAYKKQYVIDHPETRKTAIIRYGNYKRHAERRGFIFNLTLEEFKKFDEGICQYCGIKEKRMGIYRVDSNLGYISGNMVTACKWCNRAKNNRSAEDFIAHSKRIANFNP
jgi:hypothetical protein